VLLRQRKDAEYAADPEGPFLGVNLLAEGARVRPDVMGALEQHLRAAWSAPRQILLADTVMAAPLAQVLA
jgi:hypothetical protein